MTRFLNPLKIIELPVRKIFFYFEYLDESSVEAGILIINFKRKNFTTLVVL